MHACCSCGPMCSRVNFPSLAVADVQRMPSSKLKIKTVYFCQVRLLSSCIKITHVLGLPGASTPVQCPWTYAPAADFWQWWLPVADVDNFAEAR